MQMGVDVCGTAHIGSRQMMETSIAALMRPPFQTRVHVPSLWVAACFARQHARARVRATRPASLSALE